MSKVKLLLLLAASSVISSHFLFIGQTDELGEWITRGGLLVADVVIVYLFLRYLREKDKEDASLKKDTNKALDNLSTAITRLESRLDNHPTT